MRLRQLTVAGFRGFNEERTLDFDDNLTLVAAKNSYGKTSVSEALEFLIFGQTSKVAHAESKEEYQRSYRNRHYPDDQAAFIQAQLVTSLGTEIVCRLELTSDEQMTRYVDGTR